MKQIHPHALFRLSVLGPLASRDRLEQGALARSCRPKLCDSGLEEDLLEREDHRGVVLRLEAGRHRGADAETSRGPGQLEDVRGAPGGGLRRQEGEPGAILACH